MVGLYEVDVGLKSEDGTIGDYIMLFADLNNDRYTDVITLNDAKTIFTIHLFDPIKNLFSSKKSFKPIDCLKITNIAAGRQVEKLRLFLTCA
jgi:hypothetical protein